MVVLASFSLSLAEAAILLGLFVAQVLTHLPEVVATSPGATSDLTHVGGYVFGVVYLVIAVAWLVSRSENRSGLVMILKPSAWVQANGRVTP